MRNRRHDADYPSRADAGLRTSASESTGRKSSAGSAGVARSAGTASGNGVRLTGTLQAALGVCLLAFLPVSAGADTTPPALVGQEIKANQPVLQFSEELIWSSRPDTSAFAVTVDEVTRGVASVAILW